jgi:hypothetical protein
MIGGAVIGGGAGAGGALLSSKKKGTAQPIQKLSDTPEGQLYQKTLQERMSGIGLIDTSGYDPSVLNSNTAPYAKSAWANYKNYTMPQISSQASSRGLGRSTIPVNIAAQKSQETGQSIDERVAQLTLQNEQEKANERLIAEQEKQNAITQYGNLAGDLNSQENQRLLANWTSDNLNKNIQQQNTNNLIGSTVSGAVSGAAGGVGGGSAMGILGGAGQSFSGGLSGTAAGSGNPSSNSQMLDIINALIKSRQNGNSGMVNLGTPRGGTTNPPTASQMGW